MKQRSPQLTNGLKMFGIFMLLALFSTAFGQDAAPPYESYEQFTKSPGFALFTVNNLWLLVSAALVFLMHLGFATLESGLTQSKNTVNILFKNMFIVCVGILGYALYGFNAMYPGDFNGIFAVGSWFAVDNNDVAMMTDAYNPGYTWWTDFIFQAMFAATAATIVSGAVAERIKLSSFLIYATLLVTFIYPITGSWQWGGGWLSSLSLGGMNAEGDPIGFYDFAGSSLVHAFGGFAALAAVIVLGPRLGKYTKDGRVRPILGHSMPLAMIGVFLLWLGWYGFNGGSVLSADPRGVSYVFVTTTLAAAAGCMGAVTLSWMLLKKPDLSMGLNGILAGLVGVTAGADVLGMASSIVVGLIAGCLVVLSVLFFDKLKIDDPVGAISVHGICGVWGTLAVGIFVAEKSFINQLVGVFAVSATAFIVSFVLISVLKAIMGIRVDEEEETEGLDIGEHGNEAYPDFTAAHK